MGRSNKTAESPAPAPPPPSLIAWIFRPRRLFQLAILAAIPVFTPWLARQLPELRDRHEYRLPLKNVVLDPAPALPIPDDLIEQVQRRSELPETMSVLDPSIPKRLAKAFAEHPWIARVIEVRNEHPAKVTVRVEYRKPVALIQIKSGFYAVDRDGILLPPRDFSAADAERFLIVRGIRSTPTASAGQPWDDPAVIAVAQLAEILAPKWKDMKLTAIVAPRPTSETSTADELHFELETSTGSRILWGRAPGTLHPGELTPTQKLGRMSKYLNEFGSFDRPSGPYEIDIRHWQEITRRALPAPPTVPTNASRIRDIGTRRR